MKNIKTIFLRINDFYTKLNFSFSKINNRKLNIEVLRIISMYMIVFLHCLGQGGLLHSAPLNSINYYIFWLIEAFCFGAVNIYALISGYCCINTKHKWYRLIELWLTVFFYTALMWCIMFTKGTPAEPDNISKIFFPVISKSYWYFTSYVGLFCLMPFINIGLKSLTKQKHLTLVVLGFFIFCILENSSYQNVDLFSLNRGYSLLWLIYMYVVGAFIRLYEKDINRAKIVYLSGYIIFSYLAWIFKLIFVRDTIENPLSKSYFYKDSFIVYTSPFIAIASICLFLFFLKLKIKNGRNLICMVSSATFCVYILQLHPLIWENLRDTFLPCVEYPLAGILFIILPYSIFMYVFLTIIDLFRQKLFIFLNINALSQNIDFLIQRIFFNIGKK